MSESQPTDQTRRNEARCPVCGGVGSERYSGVPDRMRVAEGNWNIWQCAAPSCACMWLNPRPSEAELTQAYSAYYTHQVDQDSSPSFVTRAYWRLAQAYLASHWGYRRGGLLRRFVDRGLGCLARLHPGFCAEVDLVAAHLHASERGKLLDVGCGGGAFATRLASLGWEAEGLDPDPKAVATAKSRGLRVQLGDATASRAMTASFDVITMIHVIEHFEDVAAALEACYEALRPGGALVIVTPNVESSGLRLFGDAWMPLDPPRHLLLFSASGLRHMLERAGFGVGSVCSSVREAQVLYSYGLDIRRRGWFEFGEQGGILTRIRGRLYQLRLAVSLWRNPLCGEELVAIARKKG